MTGEGDPGAELQAGQKGGDPAPELCAGPKGDGSAPELQAGRVGRAHGLDGSFYVTSPRPRLLDLGTNVSVAGRNVEIVRRAGTDKRPIVRLDGVEDREGADALRGVALMVERLQAPALEEGEWWGHELEGCAVLDGEWRVGTVSRMIELPSCEALEVRREMIGSQPTGSHPPAPLIVPLVKDAIRRMAVAERRIEVDMGFLGEDGPETPDPTTGEDGLETGKGRGDRGKDRADQGKGRSERGKGCTDGREGEDR